MPPRPAPKIPATSAGKQNVFLVDGYALIYRAFFAMIARPLTTKSGENTSAVWGITNFLLRLYENYHPEYIGWVHDRGVSFRQEQYPEDKATREKLGEELQQEGDRRQDRRAAGRVLRRSRPDPRPRGGHHGEAAARSVTAAGRQRAALAPARDAASRRAGRARSRAAPRAHAGYRDTGDTLHRA